MEKKIRSELGKMTLIIAVLLGLGVYAHEFVMAGIKAKMALNLSIFALFGVAAVISFRNVIDLRNEVLALKALQVDFGDARPDPETVVDTPAIVFNEPSLLGQGYRLITEQLSRQDDLQLPADTVESLVHSVDQRINERKSVIGYFAGLMVIMGLLGAFMGLMHTVGSVSDLIGGMDVSGGGGTDAFGKMIEGMKAPLKGMSVGFSSSLFGLSTSMVLGALERCMTTAAKALRDEYEHWLSHLAMLEAAKDDAKHEVSVRGVTRILEQGAAQLASMVRLLEEGQRQQAEQNGFLLDRVGHLAATVDRLSDPANLLGPVADAMVDLARQQTRLTAEVDLLFEQAREERRFMHEVLVALQKTGQTPPVHHEALLSRLDQLVSNSDAMMERQAVIVPLFGSQDAAPGDAAETVKQPGARPWQRWLARMIAPHPDISHVRRDQRRLGADVQGLADRQAALHYQIVGELDGLRHDVNGLAADRRAVEDLIEASAQHGSRIVALAQAIERGEPVSEALERLQEARIELDVLAARAERLSLSVPHHTRSTRATERKAK